MTRIDIGRLAFVFCLSVAVLSGCGRKSDLDPPGGAKPVARTADGKAIPAEGQPFVLDPLL